MMHPRLSVAADALLATLGALVSAIVPDVPGRGLWIVTFVILGTTKVWLGIRDRERVDARAASESRRSVDLLRRAEAAETALGELRAAVARSEEAARLRRAALAARGRRLRNAIHAHCSRRGSSAPVLPNSDSDLSELDAEQFAAWGDALLSALDHRHTTLKEINRAFGSQLDDFIRDVRAEGIYDDRFEFELHALRIDSAAGWVENFGPAFDQLLNRLETSGA